MWNCVSLCVNFTVFGGSPTTHALFCHEPLEFRRALLWPLLLFTGEAWRADEWGLRRATHVGPAALKGPQLALGARQWRSGSEALPECIDHPPIVIPLMSGTGSFSFWLRHNENAPAWGLLRRH